ncbi:hypothetical protein ACFZ8E_19180 [Methylobacterium sp. HMF5984]|uniref:hypothetical protein n=1 Tax=Methylobacterium sp. HMF5984 TaxID=3367370 RepID=UPI003854EC7C
MPSISTQTRMLRHGLAMATSRAFPLDGFDLDPADWLDLEANLVEAAALLLRRRDGFLKARNTLSGLTALWIDGGDDCIGAMNADELEKHVRSLRQKANLERTKADLLGA